MKNDKIMNTITEEQADALETVLKALEQVHTDEDLHLEQSETMDRQKQITMDKIRREQKHIKENKSLTDTDCTQSELTDTQGLTAFTQIINKEKRMHHGKGKRRGMIVLIAAVMLMIGSVVTAGVQYDWDLLFAQQTGIGNVMESLSGGYVKIDQSKEENGVVVTVNQSVGDQNTQWIQIDTSIDWSISDEGYYMFDQASIYVWDKKGVPKTGGYTLYSYNNNGKVSFWIYLSDYHKINRSKITMEFSQLNSYETADEQTGEPTEGSDALWHFEWQNHYAANVIVRRPFCLLTAKMDDHTSVACIITKIELTPVSIRIEGYKNRWKRGEVNRYATTQLSIDAVTLKDGTEIPLVNTSSGDKNGMQLNAYTTFEGYSAVDPKQITSIIICGKTIKLR